MTVIEIFSLGALLGFVLGILITVIYGLVLNKF